MRVLLDENVDRKLKLSFGPDHEVVTVREHGWSGKKNGDLLSSAEAEFDVLFTLDTNMRTSRTFRGTISPSSSSRP